MKNILNFLLESKSLDEAFEESKKQSSELNVLFKLFEESGELAQSYLKKNNSINASDTSNNNYKEELMDVLLVILDLINHLSEEDRNECLNILRQKIDKFNLKFKKDENKETVKDKNEEIKEYVSSLYGYIVGVAMAMPNGKTLINEAQKDLNRIYELLNEN